MGSAIRGIREFVAGGKPVGETVSELRAVQTFCALPRNERGFILCAAAFEDGSTLLKQLPERAPLLKAFAKDAQPYSLIYGLEKFCLLSKPPLTAKFALVLKALYDDDVVEEEDILKWHDAGVDGIDPDVHGLLPWMPAVAAFRGLGTVRHVAAGGRVRHGGGVGARFPFTNDLFNVSISSGL